MYNGGRDIWEMVFVCGAAFLWHFCHQGTWWIIKTTEAATWMQNSDLCMWGPEFPLIAATWLLGRESIRFITWWEDRLIVLKGLRSGNNCKEPVIDIKSENSDLGQNIPDYFSSLGCFLAFPAVGFNTLLTEVWIKSTLLKTWYFLLQPANKRTTCWLSKFTQMKRLLFGILQGPHRLQAASLDSFFSWSFLIYQPPFSSCLCLSYPLSFLCLRSLPCSHPACCPEESLEGPLTGSTGSIVPA